MFQNLRKSKKLLLIAMTCATFAIAGCGSDTTKTTGDNVKHLGNGQLG